MPLTSTMSIVFGVLRFVKSLKFTTIWCSQSRKIPSETRVHSLQTAFWPKTLAESGASGSNMQTCLGIIREGFKGTGPSNCPFPMFAFFSQREVMKIVFLSISWSLSISTKKETLKHAFQSRRSCNWHSSCLRFACHTTTPPHRHTPSFLA